MNESLIDRIKNLKKLGQSKYIQADLDLCKRQSITEKLIVYLKRSNEK